MEYESIVQHLKSRLGAEVITTSEFGDNKRVTVPPSNVYVVLASLKEDCGFDMLVDLTAVDYLYYPDAKDRFGVIYALLNTVTSERLYVKTYVNEPDLRVPSAYPLWKGADWMEREVYDMYGIV